MPSLRFAVVQVSVAAAATLACLAAATQWAAAMLAYQPALGAPVVDLPGIKLYAPWKLFTWWLAFDAQALGVFARAGTLAALGGGTSFSLQGLWVAPWLTDVAVLDRSTVVEHLILMAAVLSVSALLLGALAERLRRAGIPTEMFLAGTLVLSMAAQLALLIGLPVSSHVLFATIAAAGAAPVLSFAILARYFPKEVAGRPTPPSACSTWARRSVCSPFPGSSSPCGPPTGTLSRGRTPGRYSGWARVAVGLSGRLFFAPKHTRQPIPMAHAVARALGLDASAAEIMPLHYRAALAKWRRHVVDARRQATAWRVSAVASMALCVGIGGVLSLALVRPAVALLEAGSARLRASEGRLALRGPIHHGFGNVLQHMTDTASEPGYPQKLAGSTALVRLCSVA